MRPAVAAGRAATQPQTQLVVALLAAVALVAGCAAPSATGPTYPPQGVTPPPPGDATRAAVALVVRALDAAGLEAAATSRPYRPPEAARLSAAPRTIVQVELPQDPQRGVLAVYGLGSPEAAFAAAEEQAAYIATGPGGIQFPPDARVVLRVVGSSVVFFSWSPGRATDPRTAAIADALGTVGTGVPVGR